MRRRGLKHHDDAVAILHMMPTLAWTLRGRRTHARIFIFLAVDAIHRHGRDAALLCEISRLGVVVVGAVVVVVAVVAVVVVVVVVVVT